MFREEALDAAAQRLDGDQLLRVTAPNERILLVAIGLSLLGLGAWTFFGTITREVRLDGVLLAPERQVASDGAFGGHRVRLDAPPAVFEQLHSGMPASVEVFFADGTTRRLKGTVRVGEQSASVNVARLIDIDLEPVSEPLALDGIPYKVRINLGDVSPATLFGIGAI